MQKKKKIIFKMLIKKLLSIKEFLYNLIHNYELNLIIFIFLMIKNTGSFL